MDFKKKLKTRLYLAIAYIVIGALIVLVANIYNAADSFFSTFGLVLAVCGVVRIRNHFIITKDEESIRKQEITETDERTVMIVHKARSMTFILYVMVSCVAVIALMIAGQEQMAQLISYSVCILIAIYWACYLYFKKKY